MQNTGYWWSSFVPCGPEDERGLYPQPGKIVEHYRLQKGWTQAELAKQLGVQVRMVSLMEEHSLGLDSVQRRRTLAALLAIPPELLGLDPEHAPSASPEGQGQAWWSAAGFPAFAAGPDGYPQPGPVLKHYRLQRSSQQRSARRSARRSWTQAELAAALDLSELTVRRMENRSEFLDAISRRRMLMGILNVPPQLLGLDAGKHPLPAQARKPPTRALQLAVPVVPEVDLLQQYRQTQQRFWQEYHYAYRGPQLIARAGQWIKYLHNLAPLVRSEHLEEVLTLEIGYHDFISSTAIDLHDLQGMHDQTLQALNLARTLHDLEKNPTLPRREQLALQLESSADVLEFMSEPREALAPFEEAYRLVQDSDVKLKSYILMCWSMKSARAAQDATDARQTLRRLDKAERLLEASSSEEDPYSYLNYNPAQHRLALAGALLNLHEPRASLEVLDEVARLLAPTAGRRQVSLSLQRARAYFEIKEYPLATELALQALFGCQAIGYRWPLPRIIGLYRRLKASSYGSSPAVARLGWLLTEVGEPVPAM